MESIEGLTLNWAKEVDVDDYVKKKLESLGLIKGKDFREKDASEYLKNSLRGASKTKNAKGIAIPDFTCEKYKVNGKIVPIIIECKLSADNKGNFINKLEKVSNDGIIDFSKNAISRYALNGALHYARCVLDKENEKDTQEYTQSIAIAIAGNNPNKIDVRVYYVFGSSSTAFIKTPYESLDFLSSQKKFDEFMKVSQLTDIQKHEILIKAKNLLSEHSKKLNKLMHSHNITAPQRVLYVSGMILAMQPSFNEKYKISIQGLKLQDLQGSQKNNQRDGELIYENIENFLKTKIQDSQKRNLMLASFSEIKKDIDRDKIPKTYTDKEGQKKNPNDKIVADLLSEPASINKQIFAYIYHHIYKEIDGVSGHLDIMGELYSEFLKYALGDGKELGIVLTPPYVTKMMAEILGITQKDRVMDLATGSAGFLISAMTLMCDSLKEQELQGLLSHKQTQMHILDLKRNQLLGVELNAEMFTLATTNMILRGDGSSKIYKGNSFDESISTIVKDFQATKILLNPPFTFDENGMPFIKIGLDNMPPHALGAIIIQDSAGSGKAVNTNKEILKRHTLKASIKMPKDLFEPMAGVQTSIYIFEVGIPHDYEKVVKFIDFRNDGYKRTERTLEEKDSPLRRYKDIIKIYKAGLNAKVDPSLWNLEQIYIEDFITDKGNDWNFDQHKKIDTKPTLEDFKKCVSEYLAWEVSNILKNKEDLRGKS